MWKFLVGGQVAPSHTAWGNAVLPSLAQTYGSDLWLARQMLHKLPMRPGPVLFAFTPHRPDQQPVCVDLDIFDEAPFPFALPILLGQRRRPQTSPCRPLRQAQRRLDNP